jgi:hypothetical protein
MNFIRRTPHFWFCGNAIAISVKYLLIKSLYIQSCHQLFQDDKNRVRMGLQSLHVVGINIQLCFLQFLPFSYSHLPKIG